MKSTRYTLALSLLAVLFTPAAYAGDATTAATSSTSTAAKRYGTWGVDLDAMDKSVKPGDDFFRYVNGKWAATAEIPAAKTSYGAFAMLRDLSEVRVHEILERFPADKNLQPGSDEAKIATIYRSFLDEAAVEKLDAKPIQPSLDAAKKASSYDDTARLMARAP